MPTERSSAAYVCSTTGPTTGAPKTWPCSSSSPSRAAQLQSIQELGARLTRLSSVREIGQAIAASLDQLIDYHNVRVYRVYGEDVMPVAWLGHVGPYVGEDGESLRLKVGQGITGWVAQHGVAQNLANAAQDE